jgi:pheromone shutdown protein TraB
MNKQLLTSDVERQKQWFLWVAVFLVLFMMCSGAHAQTELASGVCSWVKVLTGKWLFGFSVLGFVGGFVVLIFGGEMTEGVKKVATLMSIIAIILSAPALLALAFSKFAAESC